MLKGRAVDSAKAKGDRRAEGRTTRHAADGLVETRAIGAHAWRRRHSGVRTRPRLRDKGGHAPRWLAESVAHCAEPGASTGYTVHPLSWRVGSPAGVCRARAASGTAAARSRWGRRVGTCTAWASLQPTRAAAPHLQLRVSRGRSSGFQLVHGRVLCHAARDGVRVIIVLMRDLADHIHLCGCSRGAHVSAGRRRNPRWEG
jgi:hypothetical protein